MDSKIIEGLMNPVRIQIVLYLLRNGHCTTKDLAAALPDIPPASLYRHVKRLREYGIIAVSNTTQVRGAVEKEYTLVVNPYEQMDKAAEEANQGDLMILFYQFVMTRLMEFNKYLEKSDLDLAADKVGFRTYPLYLSEEETDQFIQEFGKLIGRNIQNPPTPDRQLRSFSFVFMPAQDTTEK
jgi:DNA-binding transcriptional ArsR family regulator